MADAATCEVSRAQLWIWLKYNAKLNDGRVVDEKLIDELINDELDKPLDLSALKKDVEKFPDLYMYERAKKFRVSTSGIEHALKKLKISHKKKFNSYKIM